MFLLYRSNGYLGIEVEEKVIETTIRYENFKDQEKNATIEKLFNDLAVMRNRDHDFESIKSYIEEKGFLKK